MDFYKVLQEIMLERAMSIPDIARATGLSDSTVRSIIKRESKTVALDVAAKFSHGLGVSLEFLHDGFGEKNENNRSIISPPSEASDTSANLQKILLDNFDQLNQEGQERLVETSDDMVSSGKYIKIDSFKLGKQNGA